VPADVPQTLFKGPCARLEEPWPDGLLERCLRASGLALEHVGMPPEAAHGMLSHYGDRTMASLRLRVEEIFDQSPGPRAGAKL